MTQSSLSCFCKKLCGLNSAIRPMWEVFLTILNNEKPSLEGSVVGFFFFFYFGKATVIFTAGAFHITLISFQTQNILFDPGDLYAYGFILIPQV